MPHVVRSLIAGISIRSDSRCTFFAGKNFRCAVAGRMPDDGLKIGQHVSLGILFGDIKGSTAEAEVDERAAVAKLREYEQVVNRTVKKYSPNYYKVRYEGDGFMAVFDTAMSMVECGIAIRNEFLGRGWHVRLGGHFGEVYREEEGDILGADVNRAARIQSGADAGEFLVSAAVRHIVRNKAQGRQLPVAGSTLRERDFGTPRGC